MNKLPKYWAVLNDGSQEFKDSVMKCNRYENIGDINYCNYWHSRHVNMYYGTCENGFKYASMLKDFNVPVTLLTVPEFIELSKEEDVKKAISTVFDPADASDNSKLNKLLSTMRI
jgi:hypothetical protein